MSEVILSSSVKVGGRETVRIGLVERGSGGVIVTWSRMNVNLPIRAFKNMSGKNLQMKRRAIKIHLR